MEKELKELTKEEIVKLLKDISKNLKEKVTIYLIGGGNMSLKEIKATTRDIDLIVLTEKEYKNLKKALTDLDFNCYEETISEDFYKTPIIIFMKENKRIDVFIKNVSNQLMLSKEMQKRSKEYDKFNKLNIRLVSNEDIFLFKSITDREKDIEDCRSLIVEGLNWDIIKKELHNQEGKILWRFWIYEQLCRIRNKYGRFIIPRSMYDYIHGLVKEKWKNRPKDFMEDIPS